MAGKLISNMKSILMKKLFLIISLAAGIVSCGSSKKYSGKTVPEKRSTSYLDGRWELQLLFASESTWPKPPFINIDLDHKTFSGNSGCNSISGKFAVGAENYIAFDKNFISTKMANFFQVEWSINDF